MTDLVNNYLQLWFVLPVSKQANEGKSRLGAIDVGIVGVSSIKFFHVLQVADELDFMAWLGTVALDGN